MKNARRRARRLEFWEMGFKCLIIDFAALRHAVMVQERIRMLLSIDLFPHTYLLLGDIPHIKAGPLKMSLNVTVFLFQEVWKAYLRHGSLLTLMFLKLNHILDGDIHSLCRRRTLLSSIIFLGWHFRLLLGCEHTALKVAFAETWKNAALGLGLVCPSVCVCVCLRVAGLNAGFSVWGTVCEYQGDTRLSSIVCALQWIQRAFQPAQQQL